MSASNDDRYNRALMCYYDGEHLQFELWHRTKTADFFSLEHPDWISIMKVFRNNATCRRLAENEIEILKLLQGSNHFIGYIFDFELDNHMILSVDPFWFTFKDNFKNFHYDETEFKMAYCVSRSLLEAMVILNHKQVIHRNITPDNVHILDFCEEYDAKLGGFEHARVYQNEMRGTIQELHYRAPEVLLGLTYNKSVDIWSLGCTIFEIGVGHVLFHGRDELDQICRIVEVFGHFPDSMIQASPRRDEFFVYRKKEGRYYPKNFYPSNYLPAGVRTLESLMTTLDHTSENFADLLKKMMNIDPIRRLTPNDLLNQPYMSYDNF